MAESDNRPPQQPLRAMIMITSEKIAILNVAGYDDSKRSKYYAGWGRAAQNIPGMDQVLLMATVVLTRMAGVAPADGPFTVSGRNKLNDDLANEGNLISGRLVSATKKDKGIECTRVIVGYRGRQSY
ncbi:hypothetical protein Tco_0916095 [Tanacetum coccineum]